MHVVTKLFTANINIYIYIFIGRSFFPLCIYEHMFINDESVNAFNLTGSPAIIKTFFSFFLDAADKTLHQDQQLNIYSAKTNRKLHPSPQPLVPFRVGVVGVGEWILSQLSWGERRGTPWASRSLSQD